jgi:hypothetical protein
MSNPFINRRNTKNRRRGDSPSVNTTQGEFIRIADFDTFYWHTPSNGVGADRWDIIPNQTSGSNNPSTATQLVVGLMNPWSHSDSLDAPNDAVLRSLSLATRVPINAQVGSIPDDPLVSRTPTSSSNVEASLSDGGTIESTSTTPTTNTNPSPTTPDDGGVQSDQLPPRTPTRTVLGFNLQGIPANATIVDARLNLTTANSNGWIVEEKPTEPSFEEKFDVVFDYLINRYEPQWATYQPGIATQEIINELGISHAVNPLTLGGEIETAYNYTTGNKDEGWFDPIVHPKQFATVVRQAYKRLERARSPLDANLKFVEYNLQGIACQDYLPDGGNAFFGFHPNFSWYGDHSNLPPNLYMGYEANHSNGIKRVLIHSPYGNFSSPMNSYQGNWRRFPWLSDRYTSESFIFDMYPLIQESTTLRDLLTTDKIRDPNLGIVIDGKPDAYLNQSYSGLCFPAGVVSKVSFNDYQRIGGGYTGDVVKIGEPWIPFPQGVTYANWWQSNQPDGRAGLCFDYETLTLFDGTVFPSNPQSYSSANRLPMSAVVGLSFGYGSSLIQSLNNLSDVWGSSMEFIAYLGNLPYGTGFEMRIPLALHRDPTIEGNREYMNWRLDASVQHWKEKFKSPFDGFAKVFADAAAIIERTYHRWQPNDYSTWTNIAADGTSYNENIPLEWIRNQHRYTFGGSNPQPDKGVVFGIERFAQYMFKDDVGIVYPNRNDQRRFNGDTNPRHWCLDDDMACSLLSACHDIPIGQRKWGIDYSNSIWGMGVCGDSALGEVFVDCIPQTFSENDTSAMSAFPFFYNVFCEYIGGKLRWKTVPNTSLNNTTQGIPWVYDRRFRLQYLYPTMLALNTTILDYFHSGSGYYNPKFFYGSNMSGWFDISLGSNYTANMEQNASFPVVSNFPYVGRKTPSKPPQNYWNGQADSSEFELLYACMKGGITAGLDSLGFSLLYNAIRLEQA